MINNIKIGEIIRIKNREWLLIETTHKNGRMSWEQPTLILLNKLVKGINRKPYLKKIGVDHKPFKKSFKGIKLKIMKGGLNKNGN